MRSGQIGYLCGCLLVGLAGIFIIGSCSGAEEISFEPAPFTVDPDLPSEAIDFAELGLQFHRPQGWTAADSASRESFRRMQAGTALSREFYPIFSLDVFIDSATGAIAYVARVEEAEGQLEQINKRYEEFLSSRIDKSSLRGHYYSINGLNICYYLHHTDQIVNHKLLGETPSGERFLVEYVVPAFANPELTPVITSSMAGLRPLDVHDVPAATPR